VFVASPILLYTSYSGLKSTQSRCEDILILSVKSPGGHLHIACRTASRVMRKATLSYRETFRMNYTLMPTFILMLQRLSFNPLSLKKANSQTLYMYFKLHLSNAIILFQNLFFLDICMSIFLFSFNHSMKGGGRWAGCLRPALFYSTHSILA
jgi:hypothetical protein